MRIVAIALVAIIAGSVSFGIHNTTKDTVSSTVVHKERVVSGSGENRTSKFMIFTDAETLENTDTIWALKWNSADIYGKIPVGSQCRFQVVGFRIPFLSMYRNILSADCT